MATFRGTTAIHKMAEQRRDSSQKNADRIRMMTLKIN
jgi:hypothetical protein